MRTAYDALRRAVVKDFGRWYRKEWSHLSGPAKKRVQSGIAYNHFGNPVLTNLSELCIGTCPGGMCYIRGKVGMICEEEEVYQDNLRRLMRTELGQHFWIYSSFSFDDWFELIGFKDKKSALRYYKKQKKREDDLFYTFWYEW